MKLSYYNFYIPISDDAVLLYNSIRGSYLLLNQSVYGDLLRHKENLSDFETSHPNTFLRLCRDFYVVDDSIDELSEVQSLRLERRFNSHEYHVTINTSMNCNLKCWYCYENHITSSNMSMETASRIAEHLKRHHRAYGYKVLRLGFFGGEPLLNPQVIKFLLSDVRSFANENDITLFVSFTTNGTCLTEDMLVFLRDYDTLFQITLDGDRDKHNSIRFYKKSQKGSYTDVINSYLKIGNFMDNYKLTIRINFDGMTIDSLPGVLDDIDALDRKKCSIGLHKVWQVPGADIDYSKLYKFIDIANERHFLIEYNPIGGVIGYVCYADNFHQTVFNYNGEIFKCTARDFVSSNREGVLTEKGGIRWDADRIATRMGLKIPTVCRPCKLYPTCVGICSQRIMDSGKEPQCLYGENINIEDIILLNFNQYAVWQRIQKLYG